MNGAFNFGSPPAGGGGGGNKSDNFSLISGSYRVNYVSFGTYTVPKDNPFQFNFFSWKSYIPAEILTIDWFKLFFYAYSTATTDTGAINRQMRINIDTQKTTQDIFFGPVLPSLAGQGNAYIITPEISTDTAFGSELFAGETVMSIEHQVLTPGGGTPPALPFEETYFLNAFVEVKYK